MITYTDGDKIRGKTGVFTNMFAADTVCTHSMERLVGERLVAEKYANGKEGAPEVYFPDELVSFYIPRYAIHIDGDTPPIDWRELDKGMRVFLKRCYSMETFVVRTYMYDGIFRELLVADKLVLPKQDTAATVVDIGHEYTYADDTAVLCKTDEGFVAAPYTLLFEEALPRYNARRKLVYEYRQWKEKIRCNGRI